ncbi:hypothetical protein, partial [Nitrolancea hollandica]|uniref:hypothetical protein n=1 Tax=Nitrolancea hollandica TaxID=1206749 RepID=UPI00135F1438
PVLPPTSLPNNMGQITPSQAQAAALNPGGAIDSLLQQRGISANSPLAELYADQAAAFGKIAPLLTAPPGEVNSTNSDFLPFLSGYLDAQFQPMDQARPMIDQTRNQLDAQIRLALTDPNSGPGTNFHQYSQNSQLGNDVYWVELIQPALEVAGAPDLFIQSKRAEFERLKREYAQISVARGGAVPPFGQYLAQRGYSLFDFVGQ